MKEAMVLSSPVCFNYTVPGRCNISGCHQETPTDSGYHSSPRINKMKTSLLFETITVFHWDCTVNSLWCSKPTWWQRSGLTLVFRQWLVARCHQTITWTNVDLSSVLRRSSEIRLRAISEQISNDWILHFIKWACLHDFSHSYFDSYIFFKHYVSTLLCSWIGS